MLLSLIVLIGFMYVVYNDCIILVHAGVVVYAVPVVRIMNKGFPLVSKGFPLMCVYVYCA